MVFRSSRRRGSSSKSESVTPPKSDLTYRFRRSFRIVRKHEKGEQDLDRYGNAHRTSNTSGLPGTQKYRRAGTSDYGRDVRVAYAVNVRYEGGERVGRVGTFEGRRRSVVA